MEKKDYGTVTTKWKISKKVKTDSCFDGEYLHKYIKLDTKFTHHMDFLQALKDGKFADVINEKKRYDGIQFRIDILTEKVTDTGKVKADSFYICTDKEDIDPKSKYLEKIQEQVVSRVEQHEVKGSGLHYIGVKEFEIAFYTQSKSVKKYAKYLEWPDKLPGIKHVINIKTDTDCVELSMVAHFERNKHLNRLDEAETEEKRKEIKKSLWLREARHYRSVNQYGKYFTFPKDIKSPVTLDDFDKIEKKTNTDLTLYGMFSENEDYDIKIIRKGNNPNAPSDRKIFLCALFRDEEGDDDDIHHVTLIKDLRAFIRCIRTRGYGKKQLKSGAFCIYCLCFVNSKKYDRHVEQCRNSKGVSNVRMPLPGETYHFKSLHALEMAPFVSYYDFESILEPTDDPKILSEHIPMSYAFIICDKNGDVMRKNYGIAIESGLANEMIHQMKNDFIELVAEAPKNWIDEPILTKDDEKKFQSTNSCEVCKIDFNKPAASDGKKPKKMRHHRWDAEVEYDDKERVLVGNYVAALCSKCNFRITLKQKSLVAFAHNSEKYDHKFVLQGITDEFSKPNICARK